MVHRSRNGRLRGPLAGLTTRAKLLSLLLVGSASLVFTASTSNAQASDNQTPQPSAAHATQQQASEREPAQVPLLHIPHVSTPPRLDDFLDGKARADELKITGFRQRQPGDGEPVSQETIAYLSYDDRNFYVIFVCKDQPGKVRAHMSKRENLGNDDAVGIALDTFTINVERMFSQPILWAFNSTRSLPKDKTMT